MERDRRFHVYILTNDSNEVLYTGVTSNIVKRIGDHKAGVGSSFTSKYNVHKLVHLEEFMTAEDAIMREKQIKGGSRKKKIKLIESDNSTWRDLSDDF